MVKVIISGGGTGGHVFPAIAIANALKKQVKDIDILFIGAKGRLEMEKVPAAGYPIEGLSVSGFVRRLTLKNLSFPFKLAGSLLKARSILTRFKPDVVVGVGGYASGPTLRMAAMKGIPALIQEQNSFPGVTNRLLASKVKTICVAYDGMEKFFPPEKIILTGNPVRQDLVDLEGREQEAMDWFNLQPGRKTLLVMGGSGGAGTINTSVKQCITNGLDKESVQVIWQTGKYYYDEVMKDFSAKNHPEVHVYPFIDRMDLAYAAADLVVSRAGAIAISELCVVGKPVILVPSPNVAEDHQNRNAEALLAKKAALLVKDTDAPAQLYFTIRSAFDNEVQMAELSRNIRAMAITDAADKIAEEVLRLTPENGQEK
jgi:UDP-N-acetylglucosamine--N-acetylmuramyl-(pentapeptide) pyrophosphoryl-undecaprenol N-acetylglucosamine transferase